MDVDSPHPSAVEHNPAEVQYTLDACGLHCPEPVMLLHGKMRELAVGDVLHVVATDPSTTRDIPKFCSFLGHELLQHEEKDGRYYYTIRKGK